MLGIYANFFKKLDLEQIQYCSWKNNHLLSSELNGNGDIDLLVNPLNHHEFKRLLNEFGFIPAFSALAEYPFVKHYYCYDESINKFGHLHVYYKLVTGDSHLKNYRLPVEQQVLTSAFVGSAGIREASPEHQLLLYLVRKHIKSSSLLGLFLLFRESKDYADEYSYILDELSKCNNDFTTIELFDSGIVCSMGKIKISHILRLKFFMQAWHRGVGLRERLNQLFRRITNKFFYHKKKSINGSLIAIVGLDGSGKSTAVEMLENWLGREFNVKAFHFGRPPATWLTWPVRVGLLIRKLIGTSNPVASLKDTGKVSDLGLIGKLRYVALAYERRSLMGRAHRFSMNGGLVVLDRYPSMSSGKMDSPRITVSDDKGFDSMWGKIESFLYSSMPSADLVVQLDANVEVAVKRNDVRNKKGKETEEEIRTRYQINSLLEYKALSFMKLDANRGINDVHAELRHVVWHHIVAQN